MSEIYLTDLIDVSVLQKVQDSFANLTGMASLTTDAEGKPVTEGSNFTDYCMKYTRQSKIGCERCEKCDAYGAKVTHDTGKATSYVCHSGLVDFAAPIMVNGKIIGSFIGGQVLYEEPNPLKIRMVADEIGVPFDEYWEAIQKIPVIDKSRIDSATESLFMLAQTLSDIAYGKYLAIQAKEETEIMAREVEQAANLKTDFLANMSHEIRTPMNAVIGLAEMALREEMSPLARDYIAQIKNSGRSLLNIINDILDYSKIDSGKMDIIDEEYECLSLFNDISNIIMTRAQSKHLELILNVNKDFPYKLKGDCQRIRQVLINLANNAVKFTNKGSVTIDVDYDRIDNDNIMMKISVIDTGIGIKPEDMKKIFESFQQVDSKRNRNVEGTGLGLAISRKLIELMNGTMSVSSEYEKGSVFSFSIPQKIIDATPSVVVNNPENKVAIGFFRNKALAKHFFTNTKKLGVFDIGCYNVKAIKKSLDSYINEIGSREIYFFVDSVCVNDEMLSFVEANPAINFVVVDKFGSNQKFNFDNVRSIQKPLSTISIALSLNNEELHVHGSETESVDFDFIAPEAKVLIVDDNSINLSVAEGLIEPLRMKVFTALSGKDAISKIEKEKFDLIFMDHMMPEMDGVETTRVIRRLYKDYDEVPIIALTANVVGGMKEMFLSEGMNDFVPKPIELKNMVSKIKQWLPIEKIQKNLSVESTEVVGEVIELPDTIGDLDVANSISLLGNKKLYKKILKAYYKAIPSKSEEVINYYNNEDWPNYTIEVHALKSLSKQIGAIELSEMAANLEKAGNSRDTEYIRLNTMPMLERYKSYESIICQAVGEDSGLSIAAPVVKKEADKFEIIDLLDQMFAAVDDLDMDSMEQIFEDINQYAFSGKQEELLKKMQEAVDAVDVDTIDDILYEWKAELE